MKVHYVTGSRADFGLMRECLRTIDAADDIELSIVATGQALIRRYGDVAGEIAAAGLRIAHRIPVTLSGGERVEMAYALADEIRGFAQFWSSEQPGLVLVLGDRGEMLAAALAAFNLCIPIAHVHGGERSGTLDEGFRHAISKLATYHFAATEDSRIRLERLGEEPDRIAVIGAPGLVELSRVARRDREWLHERFGLPPDRPCALVLFHPVVQEGHDIGRQVSNLVDALLDKRFRAVVLRANSDSGGLRVDEGMAVLAEREGFVVLDHLERGEYLQALSACDVIVGNSSSGIIESASLGTPCVNLGSRQDGRLRNENVVDCPRLERVDIEQALDRSLAMCGPFRNLYGDGLADIRLLEALRRVRARPLSVQKQTTY